MRILALETSAWSGSVAGLDDGRPLAECALPEGTRFLVLAPVIRGQKGEYKDLFEDMLKRGFVRARADGQVVRLTDDLKLDRRMKHRIEIVIDRLKVDAKARPRLAEAVEQALTLGEGSLIVAIDREGETCLTAQGRGCRALQVGCGDSPGLDRSVSAGEVTTRFTVAWRDT